jgi:hypothetical protein
MTYVLALLLVIAAPRAAAVQAPGEKTPRAGSTVTVTGCLAAGEQPGTFLLTSVKWEARPTGAKTTADHQGPESTATKTAPAEAKSTETLRLAGLTARPRLSEHVGHTVTLTGMLAAEDRVVTPGIILPDPPGGGTRGRAPAGREADGPRILNVRSRGELRRPLSRSLSAVRTLPAWNRI